MNIFDQIRALDFNLLYKLYVLGQSSEAIHAQYIFWARYGIVLSGLSFIYLIWHKRINAMICSMMAMALAGFVDLTIYLIWKRPRPYIAHADAVFPDTSGLQVDVSSFPSSHTYICFAVAVSTILYGHKRLGSALLAIALLVAISRIGAGLHYPSDIIGGALLGTVSGIVSYLMVRKYEKHWEEPIEEYVRDQEKSA